MSGSLNAVVAQGYNYDPSQFIGNWIDVGRKQTALQQAQFTLGQEKLGPAYSAMRMLQATNPNPSDDDIKNAFAQGARNGGNIDPIVANYSAWRARGGSPADFLRAQALGGMSPVEQYSQTGPQFQARQTNQGTYYGVVGGPATPNANVFSPTGFVAQGLTPGDAAQNVQVGVTNTGQPIMAPRGGVNWPGVAGQGGGGAVAPPIGGTGVGVPASQATNNFGNIRAPGGGFASYATPQDGVAAMASNLGAYQDQHGINTLNGITARWAPAGDGNNNPVAYAAAISKLTGIDPNAQLNLHDPATLAKIIPAMAQIEHGRPMAVGGDVLAAGINAGVSGRGGGPVVASSPAPSGPFIGATAAQPAPGGGGGGMQYFPPAPGGGGIPGVGGTPGTYGGYTGLPSGFEQVVQPQIQRANQLQQGMAADIQTRSTLKGMEAELANMPGTGIPAGPLGTLRNLAVSAGLVSQQTADSMARTQSAQEQFEKFAALLQVQQLGALTGQATDERQALASAATPGLLHTKQGNLNIIHTLEGNQAALQVMGRAWQAAVNSGQASPQQFDAWRNQFTEPDKNGGKFDPRVFWMAMMPPDEQRRYGSTLPARDQQELKRNVQFAEQHGWVFANQDGSFGTSY